MDIKAAIYHYCNYQERCHAEVRNKLYELGCTTPVVEQYIVDMIEIDMLNEERYAKAYVRGKFRMLKWGRQKLVQQLRLHKISEYCIKKGLQEIEGDIYDETLLELAKKKRTELKGEKNVFILKSKLYRYLMQKGYENDLIQETINRVLKPE